MMEMSVQANFNLNRIKLDLTDELNDGLDIIAKDIESGIKRGAQFNKPFKRNAEKTVKKKGFDHPLKHTELMMDAKKMIKDRARKSRQEAILMPNERRQDIAAWNQEGTDHIPPRPFFGISKDAERKIILNAKQKIEREVKYAGLR